MALLKCYVNSYNQLPALLKKIQEGEAPEKFTREHLKDLGFSSSNMHPAIPLLKGLGFLNAEGTPTSRYHDYRDKSRSKAILGAALKEAYGDLFVINASPSKSDKGAIEGKFKSAFNVTERLSQLMASTFYSLLEVADLNSTAPAKKSDADRNDVETKDQDIGDHGFKAGVKRLDLQYNIQIHLPASKDMDVYNAIFKSLREQLIG